MFIALVRRKYILVREVLLLFKLRNIQFFAYNLRNSLTVQMKVANYSTCTLFPNLNNIYFMILINTSCSFFTKNQR
jgi:hypothetical protein